MRNMIGLLFAVKTKALLVNKGNNLATFYLFKVNIETLEKSVKFVEIERQTSFWCFFLNFDHISFFSSVSIVDFKQVNVCWETL